MTKTIQLRAVLIIAAITASTLSAFPQSTEQLFPTPVSVNEVNGAINPRNIGDSRATTFYYTFNGAQGDLFFNIVTTNLNADIDLFIEQGLRPLTKVSVYADRGETETGRVVYLRKPEKLLLRVQGRSPNDDPGKFRFKFAGSFIAASADVPLPPELPKVPSEMVAAARPTVAEPTEKPAELVVEPRTEGKTVSESDQPKRKPKVIVSETVGSETKTEPRETVTRKPVDPMANFSLVVVFRDGSRIERPMADVSRFGVDKGTLTIVPKAGQTGRYSMADVVSVTVQ
jgi:hypothetical protein